MKIYIRVVSIVFGLSAVLLMGVFISFFIPSDTQWLIAYSVPLLHSAITSILWLLNYLLIALTIGEFLAQKQLRAKLWCTLALLVFNTIWCILFYCLHKFLPALAIISLLLANLIIVLIITIKSSKYSAFLVLPILIWYLYLFGINILILVFD